jgi:hypothetical protein
VVLDIHTAALEDLLVEVLDSRTGVFDVREVNVAESVKFFALAWISCITSKDGVTPSAKAPRIPNKSNLLDHTKPGEDSAQLVLCDFEE